eukprot:s6057_g2.t1
MSEMNLDIITLFIPWHLKCVHPMCSSQLLKVNSRCSKESFDFGHVQSDCAIAPVVSSEACCSLQYRCQHREKKQQLEKQPKRQKSFRRDATASIPCEIK